MLPETPPPPAAGDLLSCFAKKVSKEGDPASPVIRCANDSPALLATGGRRRTRPSGSDSCAGKPRPLLRCSAAQTGFHRAPSLADGAGDGFECGVLSRPSRDFLAAALLGGSDGLFGITEPLLKRLSGFNPGWVSCRLPRASRAFNGNDGTRRGAVPGKSPFQTAEQHSNGRGLPARLSEPAQPASSAPAACCEQRREVVRASGRPVWPGRLLCLLSWRRKKVGRPPGRKRGFAEHCSAPLEPAGCANPAVERVPANPCKTKAPPTIASCKWVSTGEQVSPCKLPAPPGHLVGLRPDGLTRPTPL